MIELASDSIEARKRFQIFVSNNFSINWISYLLRVSLCFNIGTTKLIKIRIFVFSFTKNVELLLTELMFY